MKHIWRLDSADQTLVIGTEDTRLPSVLYWGAVLPEHENLDWLLVNQVVDTTGGMLDRNPDLSICPESSKTFPGEPGFIGYSADGAVLRPDFRYQNHKETEDGLLLTYSDETLGIVFEAEYLSHQRVGLISCKSRIKSTEPVKLHFLAAPVVPAPQASNEFVEFSGRWCGEFQVDRSKWHAGMRCRDNHTGRTGHEHFPGVIMPCFGASNTHGDVYAVHYGWSGGHRMVAEELADGRRQVQFGHASGSHIELATEFETADQYLAFSQKGMNGCSVAFQRFVRDELTEFPKGKRNRPVHYNCWESVYFDHDIEVLKDIATRVATLGAERFVLDDGWFGKRDDDTTSLGDWFLDEAKYPDGLQPLIDHVQSLDMTFGIWFEPEMVSPQSELYKQHPDWILGLHDQTLGRHQLVLDIAKPDVSGYVFNAISTILQQYPIDYVKWDHNRVLPISDAKQTYALYGLLQKLRRTFPDVEFESCASGGGRIDFGILEHTSRVWLSDSNDALERLKIQHNSALFLPAAVTGSHVGPRTCHTSGRTHNISFRAWVAAQRHLGFEMDPRELDGDECIALQNVTRWWKDNRDWMMSADILRLDASDPVVLAEQHLSENQNRFVVFAGKTDTSRQIAPRPLRFAALDPAAVYKIELVNREVIPVAALSRAQVALKNESMYVSGAYLMNHGLNLPWRFPHTMWVIEGRKIDE